MAVNLFSPGVRLFPITCNRIVHTVSSSYLFHIIIYNSKIYQCTKKKENINPERGGKVPDILWVYNKTYCRQFLTVLLQLQNVIWSSNLRPTEATQVVLQTNGLPATFDALREKQFWSSSRDPMNAAQLMASDGGTLRARTVAASSTTFRTLTQTHC